MTAGLFPSRTLPEKQSCSLSALPGNQRSLAAWRRPPTGSTAGCAPPGNAGVPPPGNAGVSPATLFLAWRWWSVGATLPAGSHPARRERHWPVRMIGEAPLPLRLPAAAMAKAAPGHVRAGRPRSRVVPSSTQQSGNMIYITPRNRARGPFASPRITPPLEGESQKPSRMAKAQADAAIREVNRGGRTRGQRIGTGRDSLQNAGRMRGIIGPSFEGFSGIRRRG